MSLTPWHEALDAVLASVAPLTSTSVAPRAAVGRVAAAPVTVTRPVPATDVAAMDGVAVASADTPGTLPLSGDAAAGDPAATLRTGTAVSISTGAALPIGADAVVRREEVVSVDGAVTVPAVAGGRDVRARGCQLAVGESLLASRSVVTAGHLATLLAGGVDRLTVVPSPRIGVLVTGDEVARSGDPDPARLPDVNGPVLCHRIAALGATVVDLGLVGDQPDAIAAGLRGGAAHCDAMVVTGGTSVGPHDHVHRVLERIGEGTAWRLALRPSKPFVSGTVDGVPVLGIPGNPNAARVSFELLVRPAIDVLAGHMTPTGWAPVRLGSPAERVRDGRSHVVAAVDDPAAGPGVVRPVGPPTLRSLASATVLLVIPDGDGFPSGAQVDALRIV